jgi:hypothetical protein
MLRLISRRGAKVTGGADPEGVEPRKFWLENADGFGPPAGNNPCRALASGTDTPRGPRAVSSLTLRARGNQGDPRIGPLEAGTREQV